jgi:hypothetical protein
VTGSRSVSRGGSRTCSSPGGRLPVTVPRSVGQLPVHYAHQPTAGSSRWHGDYVDAQASPLWPFGHGLSYGRCTYDRFDVPRTVTLGGTIDATVQVTSVGERAADEVVQVYARRVSSSRTMPHRQLVGFCRLEVASGATTSVRMRIDTRDLAFTDGRRWCLEPGHIRLWAGRSSGSPAGGDGGAHRRTDRPGDTTFPQRRGPGRTSARPARTGRRRRRGVGRPPPTTTS